MAKKSRRAPASDEHFRALAEKLEHTGKRERLHEVWKEYADRKIRGRQKVAGLLDDLLALLFPGVFHSHQIRADRFVSEMMRELKAVHGALLAPLLDVLNFEARRVGIGEIDDGLMRARAKKVAGEFLEKLPEIRGTLGQDLQAAYEGDPAATSVEEVLFSYPAVEAIATHRLAHELYLMKVPLLPRMLNEVAHSRTGIDIHPGARIGPGFFIDHGTGVVIGETAVIGRNVKLYQGVTLGALSFPKDKDGKPVKGVKRHPNIEDGVTIYAGATVLGGATTIGRNSVIGGNCWITASVPPDTMVLSERTRQKHKD